MELRALVAGTIADIQATTTRHQLKMRAMQGEKIDLISVAEIVRMMERRLTQAVFSRETSAVLEILLRSNERLERIISIAA